jgi:ABC-2 type transport system permease protein
MRTWRSLQQMILVDFRANFRNAYALVFNLIMPLLFLFLFGSMFGGVGGEATRYKVGLINPDTGRVGTAVQAALASTFDLSSGTEAELRDKVLTGKLHAAVILPANLTAQVEARQAPAEAVIVYDANSQTSSQALGLLQSVIGQLNFELQQAQAVLVPKAEIVSASGTLHVMDYLMPGELAFMLLNAGVVGLIFRLVGQRQRGTLRHLFSTPLSSGVWVTAALLANMLLAVIQCAAILFFGRVLFGVNLPSDWAGTAVALFVSTLAISAIGLAVGSLFKTIEAASPVGVILSVGMAFLGNAMMPLDTAPAAIQTISSLMPSTYVTSALRTVMMQGQGLGAAAGDLAILAAWAVVGIAFASWQLRRQTLAA